MDLPDVCLEDLEEEPESAVAMAEFDVADCGVAEKTRKKQHGRQPSNGSLDLSALFAPIRFPSLNWRRRNTNSSIVLDEEQQQQQQHPAVKVIQVDVEIVCPDTSVDETVKDEAIPTPADC